MTAAELDSTCPAVATMHEGNGGLVLVLDLEGLWGSCVMPACWFAHISCTVDAGHRTCPSDASNVRSVCMVQDT